MLSIPGFRGLMKTKDARKDLEGWFAGFFTLEDQAPSGMTSCLLSLAKRLNISLLALVEVDNTGQAARIRAAGGNGLYSELKVPRLESGGMMAGLLERAQPATGKARVFSREEVFPEDGSWCDLIPMDSVVAYVFVPLTGMPPHHSEETDKALRNLFLLTAEDPGSEGETLLPLKTMLSAGLIGFSLVEEGHRRDREVLSTLKDLLKEEGYSIGFADASGSLVERDGTGFDALKAESIEKLQHGLASPNSGESGGASKPKVVPTPEAGNLRITAYPLGTPGTSPRHMVAVKQCDFVSQVRTRRERLKLLSRFISTIAHEIKNPLTGISAGVQYLAKRMQPGVREEETVEFILSEINRLNRIVDDLYKAAKPPQLALQQVDLRDVIGRSLICMSEAVTRTRLTVSQDLQEDLPELEADPDRLQQVLINIIKNAIEASPEGGALRIAAYLKNGTVGIRVTDQGKGIGPEDRERIFEPFYSTKDRGSGLGLCISQRIIDEHGGTIRVEAPEDGGTSFVIELPTGR